MQIRTSCPHDNKYYIRIANGGWNGAIQGKPTKAGANVLANCVGYANGRFAEIMNEGKITYQLVCNAENFIEKAKAYGLQVINMPTLGGIMVWRKGATLSGNDGAGHVAIVERIDSADQIYTSESSYNGNAFYNAKRTNNNGRWGMGSAYTFIGCIVNPAIGEAHFEDPKQEPNGEITYIVKKGDTLSGIASRFNKTYQELAQYNGIPNPDIIDVGQIIKIPTGTAQRTYVVQKGDTLSGIASKFGMGWKTLYDNNRDVITNPNLIRPGWVLKI